MKTADLMTREVVTLSPDHSVRQAALLMLERGISGLPVVDGAGMVVGIITEGDLMRRVEPTAADRIDRHWHRFASPEEVARDFVKKHSWRVGDVMTTPVVSVSESASLRRVAELLETRGIRRLPIISVGRLVGIISRGDLLRYIADLLPEPDVHGDEAIRISAEARLREAESAMTCQPSVTVEGGVVHLWGQLGSQSERDAARVVVESISGIAGLEDHTTVIKSAS